MSDTSTTSAATTEPAGRTPPAVEAPWARDAREVARALDVHPDRGLDDAEARTRLDRHGPNALREHERRSAWEILAAQFRSLIVALLVVAAALSFVFGGAVEGVAILVVLLLNAAIGFATEMRAVQSMEALRELADVRTTVRREGTSRRIPAQEVVPGDVVVVEAGDVVTADLRLVEASRLQASEAALTGESAPVEKAVDPVDEETILAERESMLYKGTAVTRGTGAGVAVSTGMETELGVISRLVEEAEEEITPLEHRLDALGRRLVWVTLALAVLVALSGILVGKEVLLIVETAIALAVAAIPEGLPIVATIALARGMLRMARRNALVERLSAVETLGSTDVILTDKTGTLTENRMTVVELALPGLELEVEEGGARFVTEGGPVAVGEAPPLREALTVGVLCNSASLADGPAPGTAGGTEEGEDRPEGARDAGDGAGPREAVGDPMEAALLAVGRRAGLERGELLEERPEVHREAFDPEVKMMATVHRRDGAYRVAVKGAPEAVLEASDRLRIPEGERELDEAARQRWLDRNAEMGREGMRVLALAAKSAEEAGADPYRGLTFLGLVGLLDPPRRDVRPAIAACHDAGVRVVMVTGDQGETARNVAAAVGLAGEEDPAVTGDRIAPPERLSDADREALLAAPVFARTSPRQKLDLIALHQGARSVVAMIGDGVNDAPALKKADIGVAMGQRGTAVAREAADMVLQDDRFGTIVTAIEQGRVIFENIRKFVVYLLSCNASEILVVALATLANAPLPILPLQILFLNLVTDVFPALALGVGEGDRRVMDRPPREPGEPVLTGGHWRVIAGFGALLTVAVLGGLALALLWLELPVPEAVSISFLILAFGQLWHVFNMADPDAGLLVNDVTRNRWVWGAVALCVGLLLVAAYVPVIADVLEVIPPGPRGWGLVLGLSAVPLVVGRTATFLWRRLRPSRPRRPARARAGRPSR